MSSATRFVLPVAEKYATSVVESPPVAGATVCAADGVDVAAASPDPPP